MSELRTADNAATRYCLGCGYILDHLPEPRCPECGREFDPDKPVSYYTRPANTRAKALGRALNAATAAVIAAAAFTRLYTLPAGRAGWAVLALYSMAWVSAGATLLLLRSSLCVVRQAVPPWHDPDPRPMLLLGLDALLLALIMAALYCLVQPIVALIPEVSA
jgi:hypothetical protein